MFMYVYIYIYIIYMQRDGERGGGDFVRQQSERLRVCVRAKKKVIEATCVLVQNPHVPGHESRLGLLGRGSVPP